MCEFSPSNASSIAPEQFSTYRERLSVYSKLSGQDLSWVNPPQRLSTCYAHDQWDAFCDDGFETGLGEDDDGSSEMGSLHSQAAEWSNDEAEMSADEVEDYNEDVLGHEDSETEAEVDAQGKNSNVEDEAQNVHTEQVSARHEDHSVQEKETSADGLFKGT